VGGAADAAFYKTYIRRKQIGRFKEHRRKQWYVKTAAKSQLRAANKSGDREHPKMFPSPVACAATLKIDIDKWGRRKS
jgi:hypothetical protein